jgi:hypothetical protein
MIRGKVVLVEQDGERIGKTRVGVLFGSIKLIAAIASLLLTRDSRVRD